MSLYSAALFLAVGVAEIYFLNDWPSHLYTAAPGGLDRAGLREIADTIGIVAGAMYSVALLVVYVPMMLIHERWVRLAADRATSIAPGSDPHEWRERRMLTQSIPGMMSQMAAVAGPWLTALIPKLVGDA